MHRVALLLLAVSCSYEPLQLRFAPCDADCAGRCVGGVCVVPAGEGCTDDVLCATGMCMCNDASCSADVCAAVECGQCIFSTDGHTCTAAVDDHLSCVPETTCVAAATCLRGACTPIRSRSCIDDDACTADACNGDDGLCEYLSIDCGPRYFSYQRNRIALVVGVPVPRLRPVIDSNLSVMVTVEPELPDGLALDENSGAISGTPLSLAAEFAEYVFTAVPEGAAEVTDIVSIAVLPGFVVNTSDDLPDAELDGVCAAGGASPPPPPALCSLRAAFHESNRDPDRAYAIYISPTAGQINLTEGEIAVMGSTFLYADASSDTKISASGNGGRHFRVDGGTLWVSDLTLKHGTASGAGSILVKAGAELHMQHCELYDNINNGDTEEPDFHHGGAIHVEHTGVVTLDFCDAWDNHNMTPGDGPGFLSLAGSAAADVTFSQFELNRGRQGGVFRALENSTLRVESSYIADNRATTGDGGVVGAGNGNCQVTLTNNTIVNNFAENVGAVLYSSCDRAPTLTHNTILYNESENVLHVYGPTAVLRNNILLNPTAECLDSATGGGNIFDDDSCNLPYDQMVTDVAQLALEGAANFGGPWHSIRPGPDSLAVDRGIEEGCSSLLVDQRGLPRTAHQGCDVGAVELQ